MRTHVRLLGLTATIAVIGVAGCRGEDAQSSSDYRGRYAGVGIYHPGPAWLKLVPGQSPADAASAKLIDDQAIIVVTDSQTGEIRACGDLTGYCVGMNPWRSSLVKSQIAPARLTDHMTAQWGEPVANTADNAAAAAEPDPAVPAPSKARKPS
jgi:hypothetical protein